MGEAKRRKKINPQAFGVATRHAAIAIKLGDFIDSSGMTGAAFSPQALKRAGIRNCGKCIAFVVASTNLMGIAYPSLASGLTKISVGMIWLKVPNCNLSDSDASKMASLLTRAVTEEVAKAFKAYLDKQAFIVAYFD